MQTISAERQLSRILSFGAGLTTIFVVSGSVTDPVNAPKLLTLGMVATACIFVLLFSDLRKILKDFKIEISFAILFVLSALNSLLWSETPFSQNIYGVYGRNNGFLTYMMLALILVSTFALRLMQSFKSIVHALLIAGYVNIAYCLWVILFGDFIGWSNPYGNILGTLGNPNFIGSFLGIFLAVFVAFAASKNAHKFYRYGALVIVPVTSFEIIESNAIQGRVVAALGVGIVAFYYIKTAFSRVVLWSYLTFAGILGTLSLLGALQIGPLTQYIYKTSVSLRGQYWLSGWNTGSSHPFSGVGMDALGDWYRRSRDAHALVLPGVNTVVNAAHNVFMDMFAFGGFPLLLSYLLITLFTLLAVLRVTKRSKTFEPVFVALVVAWAGYQVQSLISINQIGLAVWGWLLGGALIAYEKSTRSDFVLISTKENPSRKNSGQLQNIHLTMVATLGALFGTILSIPPLTSDLTWRTAQIEQSLSKTEASMAEGYFNPPNTYKYGVNIQTLESSQFYELSHKYALEAVKWNPESFDLWKVLYLVSNSTAQEKTLALENMKRLDPLNPDVAAIQ